MISFELILGFILASAVIVAVPGPNIVLVLNDSIQHGFKKSLFTILGIKAGILVLFCLSLSGLTALLMLFSSLFTIIKWVGVCYLIYLGITQVLSSFKPPAEKTMQNRHNNSFFLKGFLVSVTNPKGFFFAGAFFPQFLDRQYPLGNQIAVLITAFIILSILIEVIYALAAHKTAHIFETDHFKKISARLSGSVLILFGIGLSFVKEET